MKTFIELDPGLIKAARRLAELAEAARQAINKQGGKHGWKIEAAAVSGRDLDLPDPDEWTALIQALDHPYYRAELLALATLGKHGQSAEDYHDMVTVFAAEESETEGLFGDYRSLPHRLNAAIRKIDMHNESLQQAA